MSRRSHSMPSDTALETALRDAVARIYESGDLEELTVKRVRANVEDELSLDEGFFRQAEWKTRSKVVIEEEALKHSNIDIDSSTKPSSQAAHKPSKQKGASSSIQKQDTEKKRKASSDTKTTDEHGGGRLVKKQRKSRPVVSDDDEDNEDEDDTASKQDRSVSSANANGSHSDKKQANSDIGSPDPKMSTDNTTTVQNGDDLNDSDLSEVLDEAPAPKREKKAQTKKSEPNGKKHKKEAKTKTIDAEAEEIKSLQGWLVKCGIRKVWGKELKPYETSKEKIKHLKQMLTDAGMSGRYSKEKAASIREARELAADLEAVQEGAKLWGTEKDADAQGSRRSAKTAMPIMDFGDSDSED